MTWYQSADGSRWSDGEEPDFDPLPPPKYVPWEEIRAGLDIDEEALAAQRAYTDEVIRAYREEHPE